LSKLRFLRNASSPHTSFDSYWVFIPHTSYFISQISYLTSQIFYHLHSQNLTFRIFYIQVSENFLVKLIEIAFIAIDFIKNVYFVLRMISAEALLLE